VTPSFHLHPLFLPSQSSHSHFPFSCHPHHNALVTLTSHLVFFGLLSSLCPPHLVLVVLPLSHYLSYLSLLGLPLSTILVTLLAIFWSLYVRAHI
jgi:hypothetical protein